MTKLLDDMAENLDCIEEHPAMQVTPDNFGRRIEAAAEAARRGDQKRINNAYNELRQAAQDMRGVTSHARNSADQRRTVFQAVGILLWSFLPGTIARAVPESWHWPEAMASGMLDEASGWEAGTRLMSADDPQAWNAVVQAARMAQANRQIIAGCIKKTNAAGKPVRCTVSIIPNSE